MSIPFAKGANIMGPSLGIKLIVRRVGPLSMNAYTVICPAMGEAFLEKDPGVFFGNASWDMPPAGR